MNENQNTKVIDGRLHVMNDKGEYVKVAISMDEARMKNNKETDKLQLKKEKLDKVLKYKEQKRITSNFNDYAAIDRSHAHDKMDEMLKNATKLERFMMEPVGTLAYAITLPKCIKEAEDSGFDVLANQLKIMKNAESHDRLKDLYDHYPAIYECWAFGKIQDNDFVLETCDLGPYDIRFNFETNEVCFDYNKPYKKTYSFEELGWLKNNEKSAKNKLDQLKNKIDSEQVDKIDQKTEIASRDDYVLE